jgi:hypothetical protein
MSLVGFFEIAYNSPSSVHLKSFMSLFFCDFVVIDLINSVFSKVSTAFETEPYWSAGWLIPCWIACLCELGFSAMKKSIFSCKLPSSLNKFSFPVIFFSGVLYLS